MGVYKLPKTIFQQLNTIYRRFWWNHTDDNGKKLVLRAWDEFYKPKEEGGLGIRKPELVNKALTAKLTWRFLTNPDAIWVQLLKAKYLNSNQFWEVKKNTTSSCVWASLLESRDVLKPSTCWSVGNGTDIHIWKDPWVPFLPGYRVQGYGTARSQVLMVSDLFLPNCNQWNIELIRSLFPPTEAEAILQIRLSLANTKDKLLWNCCKSGEFSSKSVYKALATAGPSTSSRQGRLNWKRFWKIKGLSPRVQMFVWRLFTGAIATNEALAMRLPNIDPSCSLCHSHMESTDHLFLSCEVSKRIWFGSPIGLHYQSSATTPILLDLFVHWLEAKEDADIFKLACNIIWQIWKARNQVIFEKKVVNIQVIITSAQAMFNEHGYCTLSNSYSISPKANSHQRWIPPPVGSIKVNFDGATKDNTIAAGIVIRNSEGSVLACQNFYDGNHMGEDKALEAEARACLKGIELAKYLSSNSIILEGDSLILVNILSDDSATIPWRIRSIISDCKLLSSFFNSFSASYVPRRANCVAHSLAKLAISSKNCNSWMNSSPRCISHLVRSDMIDSSS
ncbi:Reverse transcriptase zinc-binding domain [Macleaya cordata]|uniref:Reverse transcriptase zinc-binding domain n=1 Tax=Macleaya cordata TaxID=56857 RepID=A0A200R8X5_MACCD|nr:Reverse transcriptase zinc-binding domain [Macleaya cordata]